MFSYSAAGCSGAAAQKRAIIASRSARVDEDVPEELPADLLLVLDPGGLDRGGVLVDDPCRPGRCGRTRLGAVLTSVTRNSNCDRRSAWSREFSSGNPTADGDEVDRVGLVGERRVVDEGGDPAAVALDRRHGAARRWSTGSSTPRPSSSTQPSRSLEPVDDLERRIVQRLGDGVAERYARVEREEHARRRGPVEAAAEHAGQERERDEREARAGRAPR